MSDEKQISWFIETGNIFDAKIENITLQELEFYKLFFSEEKLTILDVEKISLLKRKFMFWQSTELPKYPFNKKDIQKLISLNLVKEFSHNDDFSWNDLTKFVSEKVLIETEKSDFINGIIAQEEFPF